MEGDPNGVAVATPAADTAAPAATAPDTGPTDAAPAAVEGQPSETTDNSAPTPDSESVEDNGEAEGPESEDDQPRNDEERKLSRRERQRLREQERINQAIADAIAQREREREQAEETRKRQEEAAKAEQARRERLSQFTGTPELRQSIDAEIKAIQAKIDDEILRPAGADLEALYAERTAKEAQRDRWTEAQSYESAISENIWAGLADDFAFPATFPELANDPAARAAYLHNPGGIKGALQTLAETIRKAAAAEHAKATADLTAKHQAEIKALEADRNGWRARAGGGDLAPESAGVPTGGTMTYAQFQSLPLEKRREMRANQPEVVNAIYARHAGAA